MSNRAENLYESRGFVGERKGERDEMEDAYVIIDNMSSQLSDTAE